jgi:hypothetical protein
MAYVLPGAARVVKEQKRLPVGYIVVNLFDQVVGMSIGDDQIEIAIVIVIKELHSPAAHQLGRVGDAGGSGDVVKCFIVPVLSGESYFAATNGSYVVSSGTSTVGLWQVQTAPSAALSLWSTASVGTWTDQAAGFFTTISSDGTSNQIVWALSRPANSNPATVNLFAFSAPGSIDSVMPPLITLPAGTWPNVGGNANLVPVVTNGQFFVASDKQLQIFGLTTTNKGSGSITFSGSERSGYFCPPAGSPCWEMQDCGLVSLTVKGHADEVWYGLDKSGNPVCEESGPDTTYDNAATVAARLAAAINADGSSYVNAGAYNGTVYFFSKVTGTGSDYAFSTTSATAGPSWVFAPGSTSFPISPTSGTMTGGH